MKPGLSVKKILRAQAMYEEVINLDEVVTAFVQSGAEARWKGEPVNDLFSFLLQYHFHREVDEKERTTFFCQDCLTLRKPTGNPERVRTPQSI